MRVIFAQFYSLFQIKTQTSKKNWVMWIPFENNWNGRLTFSVNSNLQPRCNFQIQQIFIGVKQKQGSIDYFPVQSFGGHCY